MDDGRAGGGSLLRNMGFWEVCGGSAGSSHEKYPVTRSGARKGSGWQPLTYIRISISEFSLNLFSHSYPRIRRKKKKIIHHTALKTDSLWISQCSEFSLLPMSWLCLRVLFRRNNSYKSSIKDLLFWNGQLEQDRRDWNEDNKKTWRA